MIGVNVLQLLSCATGGYFAGVVALDIDVAAPIKFHAAGAKATLVDIACTTTPQTITLDPEPIPLNLVSNVDITVSGELLGNDLGNVVSVRALADAKATADAGNETFENPDEFGVPRRATSTALGLAGLTNFTVGEVQVLNNDIAPVLNALASPLVPLVNQALGDLDALVVGPLNELLGLTIGGADLTAIPDSLRCGGSAIRLAE